MLAIVIAWAVAVNSLAPACQHRSGPSALAHTVRANVRAEARAKTTLEVCLGRHCSRRGAKSTLELLQNMAGDDVDVQVADMSDTEHGCFDECTMGPNVRVAGRRIANGVKGEVACSELLEDAGVARS